MRPAVCVTQPGQLFASQNDAAAFGVQRVLVGRGAIVGKVGIVAFRRHQRVAVGPEGVEIDHLEALLFAGGGPAFFVQRAQPAHFVAVLGKRLGNAKTFRKACVDVEV